MFTIKEVFKKDRYSFNIYNHSLTMEDLEKTISNILFDNKILSYLFTGISKESEDKRKRILMLRRFIPVEFYNKEKSVIENWDVEKKLIINDMNKNNGYYSFFAEALMAYLNLIYLDNKLTFGVINIDETITDQHTGVDSCMYSDNNIVLGEAKFYKNFNDGKNKIINDFSNNSLMSKIRSLYVKTIQSDILIKNINEDELTLTFEEFNNKKIVLSGFILHNQSNSYEYSSIVNVGDIKELSDYNIVFYHLPIKDKSELIMKIIKRALELITDETE